MEVWTSKMRRDRYVKVFDRHGNYRPGSQAFHRELDKAALSDDTKNRKKILDEISQRCENNEKLDDVVNEIAQRDEVKKQFDYYFKNGIKDLASIFKNWYMNFKVSKDKPNRINLR